jgi:hypothetical protein
MKELKKTWDMITVPWKLALIGETMFTFGSMMLASSFIELLAVAGMLGGVFVIADAIIEGLIESERKRSGRNRNY